MTAARSAKRFFSDASFGTIIDEITIAIKFQKILGYVRTLEI